MSSNEYLHPKTPVGKIPLKIICYFTLQYSKYRVQQQKKISRGIFFFFKSVFDEPGNSSLPVMIFIHGGGLIGGNNNYNQYGPQYFMEKKVVMVVINYRLGPFGFLSMGNSDVPGNAGFRDQTLVR